MPAPHITPPRLKTTPDLPPDGLHFDMPFETYLAAPAVGSSLAKDALIDPLLAWNHSWLNPHVPEKEADHFLYGQAFHARLLEGREAFDSRYYIEPSKGDYEGLLTTDTAIRAAIAEFEEKPRSGNKPERVAQLLELWPEAPIWDEILAQAAREGAGRQAIKAEWGDKFEQSAQFVEDDPELCELVRDGYAEVSLFWHCPVTGIPKKARADVLRVDGIVDVKTFANMNRKSLRRAIPRAIANEQYPFQPSWYLEGTAVVRQLILSAKPTEAPVFQPIDSFLPERAAWAIEQWAQHDEPDKWTWLFVQKGDAPSVIGAEYDTGGMLREQFDGFCHMAAETLAEHFEEFGLRPWVHSHGIWQLEDNMIPPYVLEI